MTINNGVSLVVFWRDLGFVFGEMGIGFIADLLSGSIAIQLVGEVADAIHTNCSCYFFKLGKCKC
jgi:hypothetical protein